MVSATLVDLVDNALGAIGGAITAVKDAANEAMNAVKSGLSFLQMLF